MGPTNVNPRGLFGRKRYRSGSAAQPQRMMRFDSWSSADRAAPRRYGDASIADLGPGGGPPRRMDTDLYGVLGRPGLRRHA